MSFVNHDAIALTNSILAEIEKSGESKNRLPWQLTQMTTTDQLALVDDAHNRQLYALFGASFLSALNLIDRQAGKS